MILNPYVWLGIALGALSLFGAGYYAGQKDTVSESTYTAVVTAKAVADGQLKTLRKEVEDANAAAALERKRREDIARSAAAAADVAVAAAEARAAGANAQSTALLAQNARLLAGITLPAFVRDLAAGVSAGSGTGLRLVPLPVPGESAAASTAPVAAETYVHWADGTQRTAEYVADLYDDIYTYARGLFVSCNKKGPP